jgi:hypothetical protein
MEERSRYLRASVTSSLASMSAVNGRTKISAAIPRHGRALRSAPFFQSSASERLT